MFIFKSRAARLVSVAVVCTALIALAGPSSPAIGQQPSRPTDRPQARVEQRPILLAAGDIACDPTSPYFHSSGLCQQNRVGRRVRIMVNHGADWFVPLGDIQYETGGYRAFERVYDKAFGAVRNVTRPVPGNHEYGTPGAHGYFKYFKDKAGSPKHPWRSFIAAPGWRVLLLDSECEAVGGCGPHSRQGHWIKRKLRTTSQQCVVAAWHHPLHTSGEYAGNADSESRARKLWRLVDQGGADIVLNGHDHIYERFGKLHGMQEFVVGTGGKNHYSITTHAHGSRTRIDNRYGVLKLTMRANGTYRRAFVTADGVVRDSGHGSCTNKPAP